MLYPVYRFIRPTKRLGAEVKLQQKVKKTQDESNEWQKQSKQSQKDKDEAKELLVQSQKENEELRERYNKSELEKGELQMQKNSLQSRVAELEDLCKVQKQQLARKNRIIWRLTIRVRRLKTKLETVTVGALLAVGTLLKTLLSQRAHIWHLFAKLARKEYQTQLLERQVQGRDAFIQDIKQEYRSEKAQCQSLDRDLRFTRQDLRDERDAHKRDITDTPLRRAFALSPDIKLKFEQGKSEKLEKDLAEARKQVADLTAERHTFEIACKTSQSEHDALVQDLTAQVDAANAEKASLEAQATAARDECSNAQAGRDFLNTALGQSNNKITNAEDRATKAETQLGNKDAEIRKLQDEMAELTEKASQNSSLQAKADTAKGESDKANSECTSLRTQLEESKKETANAEEGQSKLQTQLVERDAENKRLQEEIAELRRIIASIKGAASKPPNNGVGNNGGSAGGSGGGSNHGGEPNKPEDAKTPPSSSKPADAPKGEGAKKPPVNSTPLDVLKVDDGAVEAVDNGSRAGEDIAMTSASGQGFSQSNKSKQSDNGEKPPVNIALLGTLGGDTDAPMTGGNDLGSGEHGSTASGAGEDISHTNNTHMSEDTDMSLDTSKASAGAKVDDGSVEAVDVDMRAVEDSAMPSSAGKGFSHTDITHTSMDTDMPPATSAPLDVHAVDHEVDMADGDDFGAGGESAISSSSGAHFSHWIDTTMSDSADMPPDTSSLVVVHAADQDMAMADGNDLRAGEDSAIPSSSNQIPWLPGLGLQTDNAVETSKPFNQESFDKDILDSYGPSTLATLAAGGFNANRGNPFQSGVNDDWDPFAHAPTPGPSGTTLDPQPETSGAMLDTYDPTFGIAPATDGDGMAIDFDIPEIQEQLAGEGLGPNVATSRTSAEADGIDPAVIEGIINNFDEFLASGGLAPVNASDGNGLAFPGEAPASSNAVDTSEPLDAEEALDKEVLQLAGADGDTIPFLIGSDEETDEDEPLPQLEYEEVMRLNAARIANRPKATPKSRLRRAPLYHQARTTIRRAPTPLLSLSRSRRHSRASSRTLLRTAKHHRLATRRPYRAVQLAPSHRRSQPHRARASRAL